MIGPVLTWYFNKRFEEIWTNAEKAAEIQNDTLLELLKTASKTEYGLQHGFKSIINYKQFCEHVPIVTYEDIKPFIDRTMAGEQHILWPSEINWFAQSSGTAGNTPKFIPLSYESIEHIHYKGGRDILSMYSGWYSETKVLEGKGLLIGGSHKINQENSKSFYGDLSAVLFNHLPMWATNKSTPDKNVALMDNWEKKLDMLVSHTKNEDVRSISGVPTWTMALIKRMLETTGKNNILDVWPNLELFIHGGVSFEPYRDGFKQLIQKPEMHYLETYNASEGFFGIQANPKSSEMLLIADAQVFYEFYETSRGKDKTIPLWNVRPNINYGVIITTSSGLWRYDLGDTIMFNSISPHLFKITGRTKAYINTFGEELVVENAESAIAETCRELNCTVKDYHAGPRPGYMENPGHEWFVEFNMPPNNLEDFRNCLDHKLKKNNGDYASKRKGNIIMTLPVVHNMPKGTFDSWLKQKGRMGGQHKVPRLANDRKLIEELEKINSVQFN
ncbi:MAG: GH3 auxin-responsive promoter family protein [Bacteroidia bacterium]|nr:GH3 auxin-responsive promoter family protein [Bacteroidia bacterium]